MWAKRPRNRSTYPPSGNTPAKLTAIEAIGPVFAPSRGWCHLVFRTTRGRATGQARHGESVRDPRRAGKGVNRGASLSGARADTATAEYFLYLAVITAKCHLLSGNLIISDFFP
jgi:hypothetical protein